MRRILAALGIVGLVSLSGCIGEPPGTSHVDMQYGHYLDRHCNGCNLGLVRHGTWKTYSWPPNVALADILAFCNAEVRNNHGGYPVDFCWAPWEDPYG